MVSSALILLLALPHEGAYQLGFSAGYALHGNEDEDEEDGEDSKPLSGTRLHLHLSLSVRRVILFDVR